MSVIFCDEKIAVGAFRKRQKRLGGLIGRVSDGGDDGDEVAGEEGAKEGFAKTLRSSACHLSRTRGTKAAKDDPITPVGAGYEVHGVDHDAMLGPVIGSAS